MLITLSAFALVCVLVWRASGSPANRFLADAKMKSMNVDNGRTRIVYQSTRSLEELSREVDRELQEPTWIRSEQTTALFGLRDIDYFKVEGKEETTVMLTERREGGTYISVLTPQAPADAMKLSIFKLLKR